ncbi:hypothetical protein GCM10009530_44230 [Microbispora corallina]|uniref:Uncharacterized protein n=1 Tax=Microbispora corallina TaxID=83302 RepID=A0ABQ4FX37_9ACTN|nr:hypothetical protein Mco01_23180 [Microbispora corallina]
MVGAEGARSALEPGGLQVPQQRVHRGRRGAGGTADRAADAYDPAGDLSGDLAAKGDLGKGQTR